MSIQEQEQEQLQMDVVKPRITTGYIHYGESDDLTKLFDILNEFRKNNGLKYSHQSKVSMIFFNVSSEHLDAFSQVRPFKISRFQTKSKYKCNSDISTQLMTQKDSFLRMIWDESSCVLTFLSRTPNSVHSNLVRRIFKDSCVEFQRDSYSAVRNFSSEQEDSTEQTKQTSTPDGFQRVENKRIRKPRETSSKVVRETETVTESKSQVKPKVRGTKSTKSPKSNV